ncbi:MAG: type I-C CRISPR-associated protein Cas8c/Csd1 [Thermomicrobiales bacterium]
MLLEELVAYADLELATSLPPAGYQMQPIAHVIPLTSDGTYAGPILPLATRESPRGQQREAPHIKRTVGISPKLLADTGEYVLGIARNDPKKPSRPERVAEQHRQFVEMVEACAAETGEPTVQAVATFLRQGLPSIPEAELADLDAGLTFTFQVGSIWPIDLPSVKAWWADRLSPDDAGDSGSGLGECIVCGTYGPVLERHPLKIKGIPGGQVLKDLISANAGAFESYGMVASLTAPMCRACAEKYGNALNALLANKSTSIWTKELAYAFWVQPKDPAPADDEDDDWFSPGDMMRDPDAHSAEVRALMTAVFSGKDDALVVDPRRFHAVALGASGSRVVVKDWIDTTVGEAKRNIARFFAMQELVDWDGGEGKFLPFTWIANSTVHEKGTPPPQVGKSLLRFAFAGDPLPLDLLFIAVRRNRAEQRVTRPRAVLIKLVLGSRRLIPMEEPGVMTGLDPNDDHPAYLCGRLLETLGQIQFAALGQTNTTVVNRYYGTASASPGTVLPTLVKLATNAHLPKMERDNRPAFLRLSPQLNEIMWKLDGSFPKMFIAEDQGRFALGFYHQRAQRQHDIAAARARRDAEKASAVPQDTTVDGE